MSTAPELPHLDAALAVIRRSMADGNAAAAQLDAAARRAWHHGIRPVRALVDAGVDLAGLEAAVWASRGVGYMAVLPEVVAPELLERLPLQECLALGAFPVVLKDRAVVVAMLDPFDRDVSADLARRFRDFRVEAVATNRAALEDAVAGLEDADAGDESIDEESVERARQLLAIEEELIAAGRIAELADVLIERAVVTGVSDIHIEPDGDRCEIRFRLDGVLTRAGNHPASFTQTLVNRVKILAQLDVGDRRLPQDGRATAHYAGRTVDLRVVTVPSAWGTEGCVVRLLDQTRVRTRLTSLGFSRNTDEQFRKLLSLHGGVVLATGPTGSGKTTTLYSAIQQMTTPSVKTITVEDPVEYRLPGMLQVQVARAMGFDFAAALRAVLRADPDVILVGEVRDPETARTAIGAALTGQVVLASLHAATAATAPLRLADLGIEHYMVGAALRGVINQRLVRRLCRRCRVPYAPRRIQLDDAGWPFSRPDRLWTGRPDGCEHCLGTGYRGRAVVAEVLHLNDDLRAAIIDRVDPSTLDKLAVLAGMVPIRHDALQLARQGVTSLDEITRVLGEV